MPGRADRPLAVQGDDSGIAGATPALDVAGDLRMRERLLDRRAGDACPPMDGLEEHGLEERHVPGVGWTNQAAIVATPTCSASAWAVPTAAGGSQKATSVPDPGMAAPAGRWRHVGA